MLREFCQLLVSELEKYWERSSKYNLVGSKSFPVWGVAGPKLNQGRRSMHPFLDSNDSSCCW